MSFTLRSRFPIIYRELKHCVLNTGPRRYNSTVSDAKPLRSILKPSLIGIGCGVVAGGLFTFFSQQGNDDPTQLDPQTFTNSSTLKSLPSVEISRKIVIPNDSSGLEITLFQYPTCPFCCKVRAFLDYHGLSYNVVEVNPVLRQQIKWSPYKKVPILLIKDGNEYVQLNDSSMIISTLSTYLKNPRAASIQQITQYYPALTDAKTGAKSEIVNKYYVMHGSVDQNKMDVDKDERYWRKWADDVLVHTLSPNVYRTREEALQAFRWFSEVGEWERLFSQSEMLLVVYVGAYAMWMIGKKLKKRHSLKDNVRESLYDECHLWVNTVKTKGKFFGGSMPNLADLAVYGVLSSIEGCQAFKELLENTNIGPWFYEMKQACQRHSGQVLPR